MAGGALLALPRFTLWGAVALGLTMLGAMGSELAAGRSFEVLLPLQWLIVCVLIAFVRYRSMRR